MNQIAHINQAGVYPIFLKEKLDYLKDRTSPAIRICPEATQENNGVFKSESCDWSCNL